MTVIFHLDGPVSPVAPLARAWHNLTEPLPRRAIRARACRNIAPVPPWVETGRAGEPFDFCRHVRRLCADIVARCATLCHVDVSRVLFAVTQARKDRLHGLQARLTPLRCHGGQLTRRRHGCTYQVQRYYVDGREMLYLLTLVLPRFMDREFDDKFVTLFHELYHISPAFNGDLRRHEGRYTVHSHSQHAYDRQMASLAREYLATKPDPTLHAFLRLNFAQLHRRHGSIIGVVVPRPRLIPVPAR